MTAFGPAIQFYNQLSDPELTQCFNNLRNAGKKLIVGVAPLRPFCPTAQQCFNDWYPTMLRIAALNPPNVIVELDEPLTHGGFTNNKPYVVAQTVEYIRLLRQLAPGIPVMLDEAYPARNYVELATFASDVHNGALSQTGSGIQYFTLDHDWTVGGNYGEIAAVRDYLRSFGMQFGVLFWKSGYQDWQAGLMQQGLNYRNNNLTFDFAYVNDFVGVPATTIPETLPGTYARSVRDFSNAFLPAPTSVNGLRANEYMLPNEFRDSVDGRFRLQYQGDGNLVLSRKADGLVLWATYTNTNPSVAGGAWMQGTDGNFVVYNYVNGAYVPSGWASNTSSAANAGAFLVVQSDSNVVIYRGAVPIWQRPLFVSGQY